MSSRHWFLLSNLASFACVVVAATGMMSDMDAWGWFLIGAVLTAKSPPGYASCACKGDRA